MWVDPLVEEVRKARQDHAARFRYDIEAIYQDLKNQEQKGKYKILSFPPKRLPIELISRNDGNNIPK